MQYGCMAVQLSLTLRHLKREDGPASFDTVEPAGGEGSNCWYHVTIREGRNREVRRMWEAIGYQVSRLMRVAYGPIELPANIRRGKYAAMTPAQIRQLYLSVDMEPPPMTVKLRNRNVNKKFKKQRIR